MAQKTKSRWVFAISVLLHVGLVFLILVGHGESELPPPPDIEPIKARLYTSPKPKPAPVEQQQDVQPVAEKVEPEVITPKEEKVIPEVQPDTNEKVTTPPSTPAPSKPAPETPAPEKPVAEDAAPKKPVEPEVQAVAPSPPVASDKGTAPATSLSSRKALDAYFNRHQAEKLQEQAEDVAREYRQEHKSPHIVDPRKNKTEEEYLNGPPPKMVDCSNMASKSLSFLSQFTGGNMKCSTRGADFEKFIDARLKKDDSVRKPPS
ncbi:hypothetical protein [Alteromonas sp. 14N.309.X.WAT.G.H12]|uniref:hypothetical protein n=1 Tax=Alteromonas sp. 14N.309.X.WAT.G.H12 TaxID=3120824 RepID=UPI002FD0D30B